jgi:hypothetical protein
MADQQNLSPEDELRAENELLKLKLEMEHGMMHSESAALNPEIENAWLKHIYEFEQQAKEGKRIKVYDAIGRPSFRKADELSPDGISS